MNQVQLKLIELDKKKEQIKQYYEELRTTITQVHELVGDDGFFQDPSDGTVFQIVKPTGRFVQFEELGYIRTKREGEKRGELSVKKAEEAGFKL